MTEHSSIKRVAVVILNWNGLAMLQHYLPSVVRYTVEDADVYIADNASTDGSMEWVRRSFPQVRTIQLDSNYGFAEGYNKALRQVEAEYYVLLNSDVEVTHHWLTPLIEHLDAHDDVAAAQPKLLADRHRNHFEYAGACGGFIDRWGYPYCRGRVLETVERDNGQYDYVCPVTWATGACLFIRSRDYWSVGGLDGRFFAHNEEIDLCWQLVQCGRKIVCHPESVVYHLGGGTLQKGNPMKTYLNFRNNLTMLYKNLPDDAFRRLWRVRCVLDYVAALQMLVLQGRWGDFRAVIRARRAFKQWRHDFDADRRRIAASRVPLPLQGRSPFSILWYYYVRGVKTWDGMMDDMKKEKR